MDQLNLADAFVVFLALFGPQKMLLTVAHVARTSDVRGVRVVVAYASMSAALVGIACVMTAPWIATFFHLSVASVELASGMVFFVYAIGLVFGMHLIEAVAEDERDVRHPAASGYRELLLPFIVSPLAVAAALEGSLVATGWEGRVTVAGAYVAVVVVDLAAAVIFAPLMRRFHPTALEVLSRLLGILLTAVGVNVFLQGLSGLGVHLGGVH
jgi:multiple antibiotic resistance protein